jgi:hypothetical protein
VRLADMVELGGHIHEVDGRDGILRSLRVMCACVPAQMRVSMDGQMNALVRVWMDDKRGARREEARSWGGEWTEDAREGGDGGELGGQGVVAYTGAHVAASPRNGLGQDGRPERGCNRRHCGRRRAGGDEGSQGSYLAQTKPRVLLIGLAVHCDVGRE